MRTASAHRPMTCLAPRKRPIWTAGHTCTSIPTATSTGLGTACPTAERTPVRASASAQPKMGNCEHSAGGLRPAVGPPYRSLLSRNGSIDWLCLPRFNSSAVFSAILGDADDGCWRLDAVDGEVETGVIVRGHSWWIPPGEPRPAGSG